MLPATLSSFLVGPTRRLMWIAVATGLAFYALLSLWLAMSGILYPYQLDYGEGDVLWFTRQLAYGAPLYKALFEFPFDASNYPPVAMLLAAPFYSAFGASYVPGRLLALGSTLLASYFLYRLAKGETHSRKAGACAGLLFFGSTFVYHWVPLYRIDLPALALTLGGIVLVWRWERSNGERHAASLLTAAAALFVLALYTKQSYLAAPAASTIVLFRHDRRLGILFGAGFAAAAGLVFAVVNLPTAGGFWAGLVTANAYEWLWSTFLPLFWLWLRTYGVLIALALYGWRMRAGTQGLRLLQIYFCLAGAGMLLSGRVGAWENYYFEVTALVCLFAVTWVYSIQNQSGLVRLVVPIAIGAQLILFWPDHSPAIAAGLFREEGPATAALLPVLASTPGMVVAEDMGNLILAGKEVVYYSFIYSNLARNGQWDEHWELESLRQAAFRLVVLDRGTREDVDHYRRFTHGFVSELDTDYAVAQTIGKYELYRPSPLQHKADFKFGDQLGLVGWSRSQNALGSSEPITLTVLWEARQGGLPRLTAFVHLEDERGQIVAQTDREPRGGDFPTSRWVKGDRVREEYQLKVAGPLREGDYSLRVGWYHAETGERLDVGQGDEITLDRFRVGPGAGK